jgi:hypothetical protein
MYSLHFASVGYAQGRIESVAVTSREIVRVDIALHVESYPWSDSTTIDLEPEKAGLSGIYGSWQWIRSIGGIGGWMTTPESQKASRTLVFLHPKTVQLYENDSLVYSVPFKLAAKMLPTQDTIRSLRYSPPWGSLLYMYIWIMGDTLFLNERCADCGSNVYAKIR